MKNEQFKNNVRIYKSSFSKLYMFSLSVIILFLASYSCYYLLSGYDFGLTAILIFAGGFLPLFYCLQMMIGKVSSGANILKLCFSLFSLMISFMYFPSSIISCA